MSFYIILKTFIQSQAKLLYLFVTHSNTKQFLPTLINHNQINLFKIIIKPFPAQPNCYKKNFDFFFSLFIIIQKKMLRRASLREDISQTTKERKAKFNLTF